MSFENVNSNRRNSNVSNYERNCGEVFLKTPAITREFLAKINQDVVPQKTDLFGYQMNTRRFIVLTGLILLFTLSTIGTLVMWFTDTYQNQIQSMMILSEDSQGFNLWKSSPIEVKLKIYIFNYTNVEDFERGKAEKLHVEEVGPYVYYEKTEKVNIRFSKVLGTVSYQEKRTYRFSPELSNGTQNDTLVVPNLSMLAGASRLQNRNYLLRLSFNAALNAMDAKAFRSVRAHELVTGYEDPLYEASKLILKWENKKVFSEIGVLALKQGVQPDVFTIHTGAFDFSKISQIQKYNGRSEFDFWGSDSCNNIQASDGIIYPKDLVRTKKDIEFFMPQMCRKMPLKYVEETRILDNKIPAYRYRLSPNIFNSSAPENKCYCDKTTGQCPPKGLFNASQCTFGVPIFFSWPHLHGADPEIKNGVTGLRSNFNINDTFADIHPKWGNLMRGRVMLQINVQVHKSFGVSALDKYENNQVLPWVWFDFGVEDKELTPDLVQLIYMLTFTIRNIELGLKYGCLLATTVTLTCILLVLKRQRAERCRVDSVRQPMSLKIEDLKRLDGDIYALMLEKDDTAETDLLAEMEGADGYVKRYTDLSLQCEECLQPRVKADPDEEVNSERSVSHSIRQGRRKFKLPILELKKFDGNIKDWLPFWSQFQKVHNDLEIDDNDKVEYLIQATVQGSWARQLVESFPATGSNYSKMVECLQARFGREDLQVEVYVRELLKLVIHNTSSGNRLDITRLYDKLETQLRALETLGITSDKYAAMLFPLVESCLPPELLRIWQRTPDIGDTDRRVNWPLGRVIELLPGKDGEVRVVRVSTERGQLLRPVRLYPLECAEEGLMDSKALTSPKSRLAETNVPCEDSSESAGDIETANPGVSKSRVPEPNADNTAYVSRSGRTVRVPFQEEKNKYTIKMVIKKGIVSSSLMIPSRQSGVTLEKSEEILKTLRRMSETLGIRKVKEFRTNKRQQKRAVSKCRTIALLSIILVTLAYGIFTLIYSPVQMLLNIRLQMTPGLPPFDWWVKPPDEVLLKAYVFNVTNPDDFMKGKDKKLHLQEIGPIVFREKLTHTNTKHNPNGTLSFTANRTAIFLPERNTINLDDTITAINLGVLLIPAYFHDASMFIKLGVNVLLRSYNVQPLKQMTIREFLWNSTDPVLVPAKKLAPNLVPTQNVGLLHVIYKDFENNVTVYIGKENGNSKFFTINTYDGSEYLPHFSSSRCQLKFRNSSEGVGYPQMITKETNLTYWRRTLCKLADIRYQRDDRKYGINAYRFQFVPWAFNRTEWEGNKDCFAGKPALPDGISDVSACYWNFPIAASFPHYLYADPRVGSSVKGLNPNEADHASHVLIEPITGIPLGGKARSQINLVLKSMRGFPRNIQAFTDTIIPLAWLEYHQEGIPWYLQWLVYFTAVLLPTLETPLSIISLLISGVCLYYAFVHISRSHLGSQENLIRNKRSLRSQRQILMELNECHVDDTDEV
ncbi:uncharacterized protein LOC126750100 [Anthonomus grandis grandis]|uniref:uncharacterized protein LOC126750100 n=1 Tax=Anthonomus grandis grandis TaxID=2921223 RepID=UPI00216603B1|nr:uncharacterized protein LOC126750100 [Anthonomus grandis grandis]